MLTIFKIVNIGLKNDLPGNLIFIKKFCKRNIIPKFINYKIVTYYKFEKLNIIKL